MLLSDKILAANETVLNEMLTHRFVADICADRLEQSVFHRYLAYEGQFVETAISIFAYAVAYAPDITAQRWLIGVLDALANTQVTYFEEVFARLDIPPMPQDQSGFGKGMLDIARRGPIVDILTAMFAAEWMYWTWCSTAAAGKISDPDLRAWVDLHAEPEFAAQALWLKQAIDTYGDECDVDRLCAIFDRVTRLEIAFHSAAYDVPSLDQGSSQ
ncbi:TenA family protein [Pacificibacter marinus]|uniref:TenA family protein n=1 Tax=Pacificibacter marinus TaxID=658057 RepID=UPI001C064DDC|nr:TenA family protein [Pacificibacter marinus]MBU2867979.1 TenA family protein [Pacificibacter marinus]